MGLLHPQLLILSHIAFFLVSSSAQLTPAPAPSFHHHHHHHHLLPHHKPITHHPLNPAYAPSKPPVPPPTKPPTIKPPAHPPVKPPAHPPVKLPTKPPVLPVKPPVHPPLKPPTKPPVPPPVKPPAHPPVKPPTKPPTYPPVKPPAHPPVKPPAHPPLKPPTLKPLAVQGVVNCKNCSYAGVNTLLGSAPLLGATVVLKCRSLNSVVLKNATTDKNGYFFLEAPKGVVAYKAAKYCHVYLGAAPAGAKCQRPSNINGGRLGGLLKPQETLAPLPYILYNVGPFAFEPPVRRCRKPVGDAPRS